MSLNWSLFEKLPGSPRDNFEDLCLDVIKLNWQGLGNLTIRRNQPGVECVLRLDSNCPDLGLKGSQIGWQCKYIERNLDGSLKSASKVDIIDSINKTEEYFTDINSFILWTPFILTKADQKWFKAITTKFDLKLWSDKDLELYINKKSPFLKEAYFGELVIDLDCLQRNREISINKLGKRWIHKVHQKQDAENKIRKMLLEPIVLNNFDHVSKRLGKFVDTVNNVKNAGLKSFILNHEFCSSCEKYLEQIKTIARLIEEGDPEKITGWLDAREKCTTENVTSFPRLIRRAKEAIALYATNALSDLKIVDELFNEIYEDLNTRIIAIIADAGGGKTQLAAEITNNTDKRPHGILFLGRDFLKGNSPDDIAKKFSINANPIHSFEKLVISLNATAKRMKCKLPIVIDGLNEAENPKDWKDALAHIEQLLKPYKNLLLICTLRTGVQNREKTEHWKIDTRTKESFAIQSLPENIKKLELEDFGQYTMEVVEKYFDYYKIDCAAGVVVPEYFFSHPLNLRIFCDSINPNRSKTIQIKYIPLSLDYLFGNVVINICNRIEEMRNQTFTQEDVEYAIHEFGILLYKGGNRWLSERSYRQHINDAGRIWNESLVNLLCQEGLIFRNAGVIPGENELLPAYDALGGYLIASSLIKINKMAGNYSWVGELFEDGKLVGKVSHALAFDIFCSLVRLFPKEFYKAQFWKEIPKPYRNAALLETSSLDPKFIDDETLDQLKESFFAGKEELRERLYSKLWGLKKTVHHPFNAKFLHELLVKFTLQQRDLSWSEWCRKNKEDLISEIGTIKSNWARDFDLETVVQQDNINSVENLTAIALCWILTSTDQTLRNLATEALYSYAKKHPDDFYNITIKFAGCNDAYIVERLFSLSYAIAAQTTRLQNNQKPEPISSSLLKLAKLIYETMYSNVPAIVSTHWIIRDFASRIILLVKDLDDESFDVNNIKRTKMPLPKEIRIDWKRHKGELEPLASPFRMDFENYTIGRLVPDRSPYDYKHNDYIKTKEKLLWRVFDLGWSRDLFGEIEDNIVRVESHKYGRTQTGKTDRYAKKYSWIAYYEYMGELYRISKKYRDEYNSRITEHTYDASYIKEFESERFIEDTFTFDESINNQSWLNDTQKQDILPLLFNDMPESIGDCICLDGFVRFSNEKLKRKTHFFIRSLLVNEKDYEEIIQKINTESDKANRIPDKPYINNSLWFEVPWGEDFKDVSKQEISFIKSKFPVKKEMLVFVGNDNDASSEFNFSFEDTETFEYEFESYEVISPICLVNYECANATKENTTLSKALTSAFNAYGKPSRFELYHGNDEQMTSYIYKKGSDYSERQTMLYIKRNNIDEYLLENNLKMFWVIWGEREISLDGSIDEATYSVFSRVENYELK